MIQKTLKPEDMPADFGEVILYQSEEGKSALDVHLKDETVWLTLNRIADLFERDKSVISRHFRNVFQGGELVKEAVVAKNATTASDGKIYQDEYYNLDAIISVLKDHLARGYSLNQRRLAENGVEVVRQVLGR